MDFFSAQKKLIKLWFIWSVILLLYTAGHTLFGIYEPVAQEVWQWLGIYLAPLFALITGSTFFKKSFFEEVLRDKIYYNLAFYGSIFYLILITVILVFLPRYVSIQYTGDSNRQLYLDSLDKAGFILKFILPILFVLLGYFFYKSKKTGSEPEAEIENLED